MDFSLLSVDNAHLRSKVLFQPALPCNLAIDPAISVGNHTHWRVTRTSVIRAMLEQVRG